MLLNTSSLHQMRKYYLRKLDSIPLEKKEAKLDLICMISHELKPIVETDFYNPDALLNQGNTFFHIKSSSESLGTIEELNIQ